MNVLFMIGESIGLDENVPWGLAGPIAISLPLAVAIGFLAVGKDAAFMLTHPVAYAVGAIGKIGWKRVE